MFFVGRLALGYVPGMTFVGFNTVIVLQYLFGPGYYR